MKRILTYLILAAFVVASCIDDSGKCDDVACFTPPDSFVFEITDMSNGENLFTNGTYNKLEIEVVDQLSGDPYSVEFIDENDLNWLVISSVGWKTETVELEVTIGGELLFSFYVDADRLNGDCCSYTQYNEVRVEGASFEFDPATERYTILIEP
ncbi:hypothetical protein [Mangrovibacterium sp.]|uniref:hypothetical protein n=1 Tax=Mangrovibacterium sp. TaxID=1961364 RepID=UPI003564D572